MKCMQDYISKMEMSDLLIAWNELIYERSGKKEASVGVDSDSDSKDIEDIEDSEDIEKHSLARLFETQTTKNRKPT